ncbi:TonB-dependent receptor family protein [soil metagenome]
MSSRPVLIPVCLAVFILGLTHALSAQSLPGSLSGRIVDESGAVIPKAVVLVRSTADESVRTVTPDGAGRYLVQPLAAGSFEVSVIAPGFADRVITAMVGAGEQVRADVTLEIGGLTEMVQVMPDRIVSSAEAARRIPGSIDVLDLALLEHSRFATTAEVLRKASGVHVREEEGLGLRPNIGIRGLNPNRSSRVLLLEDGIPLTYAPYGDNAAYYHPPVERFERVELLKGSGQIAYGPMTVGGVINYVTPAPPAHARGSFVASVGNRGYLNTHGGWGTTLGSTGVQVDLMRKQGDGARENISSEVYDVSAKAVSRLSDRHVVTVRGSYFGEESNLTYSGLREAEYRENPRQNPFRNDFFYVDRYGASATHTFTVARNVVATTNIYHSRFQRNWWRQSSNSGQRPNDAGDPACGGMVNLHTTCGNEGRLRSYSVWGVEPRLRAVTRVGGMGSETDLGVRAHFEDQERRQENGANPTARSGALVENNNRRNQAYAAFVQNRFIMGSLSVTPGVRVERVLYERTNRLLSVSGETELTEIIPGLGAAFSASPRHTFFAGVHRGFTPPRTEDVISNSTGGTIDLAPERSWNYEAGLRSELFQGVRVEAAFFRMDYENQVIPASVAGGIGAALTNGGETLHQGMEVSVRTDSIAWRDAAAGNFYTRLAYTWLPVAEFAGNRFSNISGSPTVRVTGNRLPYAPKNLLTAAAGYTSGRGWDVNLEAVLIDDQFGDDLNTVTPTPDGQRGLLSSFTLWNTTVNYPVRTHMVFVAVKNVFDRTEIVDRSRGIMPTAPRTVQAGIKVRF